MSKYYLFITVTTIAVIAMVLGAFKVWGTPAMQAKISRDKQKLQHIYTLSNSIQDYHRKNRRLPQTLSDLDLSLLPKDLQSAKQYTYEVTSATSYNICTDFETEDKTIEGDYSYIASRNHKLGHDCLKYTVSPSPSYNIPNP